MLDTTLICDRFNGTGGQAVICNTCDGKGVDRNLERYLLTLNRDEKCAVVVGLLETLEHYGDKHSGVDLDVLDVSEINQLIHDLNRKADEAMWKWDEINGVIR